jgi:integration host factor subunit beta
VERVEIRDFASFVVRKYEARAGRNPRTGEAIDVLAKRRPYFSAGKELSERVDYKRDDNGEPVSRPE